MQAYRRKKKKRPMWAYMRNIRNLYLEASTSSSVFGFTLSGQQPCILSSVVPNSPADLAGVKCGDFLISVNGTSVWQMDHAEIVDLITSSKYKIQITVADNCFSESSEDEGNLNHCSRPKYSHHKPRSNRFHITNVDPIIPSSSRYHTHPPLPYLQSRNNHFLSISNNTPSLKICTSTVGSSKITSRPITSSGSLMQCQEETVSFLVVVSYLGTIEMRKQIDSSSKLQTVRSCIRKLRKEQEKKSPTLVLMKILPNSLNLLNELNVILASYPTNRINYVSSSSESNSKFFGLVTSTTALPLLESSSNMQPSIISNSCHVFGIETKLIDHETHLKTAEKFNIKCTKDLISNSCLEFPTSSDYICNLIKSMYNLKFDKVHKLDNQPNNDNININERNIKRNPRFFNPHQLLANSPHPSEMTTSSNSDSGIGFHNDLKNISDRCFVVNIPDQNLKSKNLHLKRQHRPLGIVNDSQLQDQNSILNFQQSTVKIFHSKSKSADYNCAKDTMFKNSFLKSKQSYDKLNQSHGIVEDVWYDGEILDEDGNEIHERSIDVPHNSNNIFKIDANNTDEFHKMMIQSCDDILMIMNKDNVQTKDDHVFLIPSNHKKRCNKKSLTLFGKSKSSIKCNVDSNIKLENNLKNYKLSPKVYGLTRPVSMSVEHLSSKNKKDPSFICNKEYWKKQDEEELGAWGSLQELKNCQEFFQKQPYLEGTYSEPNLLFSQTRQSNNQNESAFQRLGHSSLRSLRDRKKTDEKMPISLTASESEIHSMIIKNDNKLDDISTLKVKNWGNSFEILLSDPTGLKIFSEFLKKEFSGENIYFWTACERYCYIDDDTERKKEANNIFARYLSDNALEPVNVDFNARNCSRNGLYKADKDLFLPAQNQIFNLMKFDSYQRFIRSELYKSCLLAEQTNSQLPYSNESLDNLLKITTKNENSSKVLKTKANSTKLKKSLSNAEDNRRKSLLPWNRKNRCKSKDRSEDKKENLESKHSNFDVHGSRSSLSSFDTITKMYTINGLLRNSLCRVILRENGVSTIVQIKQMETIRELIEKVLEKRGLFYQAYDVFLSGSNKSLDLDSTSEGLSGNEVFIEQRIIFKLDLPNRKIISVKSKPSKLLHEVLKPILHRYNYHLDMVETYSDVNGVIDVSSKVTIVDGMRLQIISKNMPHKSVASTYVRAEKLVTSINNPQFNSLNEITNKIFKDVLLNNAEATNSSNNHESEKYLEFEKEKSIKISQSQENGIDSCDKSIKINENERSTLIAKWTSGNQVLCSRLTDDSLKDQNCGYLKHTYEASNKSSGDLSLSTKKGFQHHKPPKPLPRTSLEKSQDTPKIKSLSVSSLSTTEPTRETNLNLSTQCFPSVTPQKNRDSFYFFNEGHREDSSITHTLNDRKVVIKSEESSFSPPVLPPKPKHFLYKSKQINKDVYLDHPTSSFV